MQERRKESVRPTHVREFLNPTLKILQRVFATRPSVNIPPLVVPSALGGWVQWMLTHCVSISISGVGEEETNGRVFFSREGRAPDSHKSLEYRTPPSPGRL